MFKALKKRLKDQRGLTLIELLAVIVILGIIAAIAVPSIGGIINNTKKDAAVSEAVQIINAAKIAQAADTEKKSWSYADLDEYISNSKDEEFTVNLKDDNSYTITGHEEAAKVVKSDTTTPTADILTEKALLELLK